MPRYTFNGKTYNIPDEKVDSFLTKNLSAEPLNIKSFSDVILFQMGRNGTVQRKLAFAILQVYNPPSY